MNLLSRNLKHKFMIFVLLLFLFSMFFMCEVYANEIYITVEKPSDYTDISIPDHKNFKSYMSYTSLTREESPQYKLQEMCTTDDLGIRNYFGRYTIAVGSAIGGSVGDYVDLVLDNGCVIECVIGDYKADCHTLDNNLIGLNGCCSEFIVDIDSLDPTSKDRGDVSFCKEEWQSPVVAIRRYELNSFGG